MTAAVEIHTHLLELQAERTLAWLEALAVNCAYMADLDGEIEATTRAYVGAAVTEIAKFRAELSGGRSCARGLQSAASSDRWMWRHSPSTS